MNQVNSSVVDNTMRRRQLIIVADLDSRRGYLQTGLVGRQGDASGNFLEKTPP
jgi:hypothetical protein